MCKEELLGMQISKLFRCKGEQMGQILGVHEEKKTLRDY